MSQTLAALQFVAPLAVGGGRDADVHHVVAWRLVVCGSVRDLLLRHDAVDFCNENNKDVEAGEKGEVFRLFLTKVRKKDLLQRRPWKENTRRASELRGSWKDVPGVAGL